MPEPITDAPLTPTLAMGLPDNDDLFFGSSPTPGSKCHSQKDESRVPFLTKQTLQAYEPSDPPSSPPVGLPLQNRCRPLHLTSPSSPRDYGSEGTGEKSEVGPLQCESINRDIASAAITPPEQENRESFNECEGDENGIQTPQMPRELNGSHSSNGDNLIMVSPPHKLTSVQFIEGCNENSETIIAEQAPAGFEVRIESPDSDNSVLGQMVTDSCSDDLELQIASQLEQDLGLALDVSDETNVQLPDSASRNPPITRKRKRKTTESPTHDRSKRRSLTGSTKKSCLLDDEGLTPSTANSDNSPQKKRRSAKSKSTPKISRVTRSGVKKSTPTKHAPMASEGPHSRESSRSPERTRLSKVSRKQGIRNHKVIDAQPSVQSDDREIMSTGIRSPESNATQDSFSDQMGETHINAGGEASGNGIVKNCACHSALSEHTPGDPATTGEGILHSLRSILVNIRKATFGRNTLREIDDVMFDMRVASYEAAKDIGH